MVCYKTMTNRGLLFLLCLFFCSFTRSDARPDLLIRITQVKDKTHKLFIAVCRQSKGFPNELDMVQQFVLDPAANKDLSVTVTNLPYGKYAVSIFQDMNGNGKLDKGLFGIPTEPFAFSNNYHPTFRAPTWDDCAFDYNATSKEVVINGLIKMF